jgi:hypothetical protein
MNKTDGKPSGSLALQRQTWLPPAQIETHLLILPGSCAPCLNHPVAMETTGLRYRLTAGYAVWFKTQPAGERQTRFCRSQDGWWRYLTQSRWLRLKSFARYSDRRGALCFFNRRPGKVLAHKYHLLPGPPLILCRYWQWIEFSEHSSRRFTKSP